MDPMMLGETIRLPLGGKLEGFWMPSGGNDGIAAIEVFYVDIGALGVYEVHLDTKSSDEEDSAATSIGDVTINSATPQVYSFPVTGAKDLVRYRIQPVESGASFMHFQFAQPLWSPN